MSIKYEKITAGMVLLDVHRQRAGNTTMREWGCWEVHVIELLPEQHGAMVSWNGNRPEFYDKRRLERLYTKPPKAYRDQQARRATRGRFA